MTRADAVLLLQTIIAMYPGSNVRVDEITVGIWHEMLHDLPIDVVQVATKRMCAMLKYPPSIADIRESVALAATEAQGAITAGDAWHRVCKAISRHGYTRPDEARQDLGADIWHAVEMVGGWREMCLSEEDKQTRSAQFERRYKAMAEQQSERVQIPASVRRDMSTLVGALTDRLTLGGGGQ